MSYIPIGPSPADPVSYEAPPGVLVYLIGQSVNGGPVRRSAAHFILDCLRSYRTPEESAACLRALEHGTLLELAEDVEELASALGLIAAPARSRPKPS